MDYVELMNSLIDQMVKRVGKTSPGIAYMVVNDLSGIDEKLRWFYRKSVRDIVTLDLARRIADKVGVKLIGSRGVIGALASLASCLLMPRMSSLRIGLRMRRDQLLNLVM
ncbi:hypothetical protein [Vulcanisaeta sp. JCM 14467]|uniref:hypothetical protein n=1 Tax=Vulcanisaeta sp. JCM 14467 TaxID=1295370 RepID=UPI000AFE0D28|nr:hypothetical protein [Vulcanisaeta sp. JCM 14467]